VQRDVSGVMMHVRVCSDTGMTGMTCDLRIEVRKLWMKQTMNLLTIMLPQVALGSLYIFYVVAIYSITRVLN
jgi:hypothetical protein